MSRRSIIAFVASVVVIGTTLSGAPALAQSKSAKSANTAADIGITAKTIRVAVVTDVDNPIVPGVLQGIVDGVKGWGKYVNANGGIAGRKVQVDFIDSKLNANDARNAIIEAYQDDSRWSAPVRCSWRPSPTKCSARTSRTWRPGSPTSRRW